MNSPVVVAVVTGSVAAVVSGILAWAVQRAAAARSDREQAAALLAQASSAVAALWTEAGYEHMMWASRRAQAAALLHGGAEVIAHWSEGNWMRGLPAGARIVREWDQQQFTTYHQALREACAAANPALSRLALINPQVAAATDKVRAALSTGTAARKKRDVDRHRQLLDAALNQLAREISIIINERSWNGRRPNRKPASYGN